MVGSTKYSNALGGSPRKCLHFFWLVDCSGSMAGTKIQTVNQTIRDVLPETRRVAARNPWADLLMRVITFSSGATWRVATPTPVGSFEWTDLEATGETDLGAALRLLTKELDVAKLGLGALPPVIVLLTDGAPTDGWEDAVRELDKTEFGKAGRTVRVGIAIGPDGMENRDVLERFAGPGGQVLEAKNARQLSDLIVWASVVLSSHASSSKTTTNATGTRESEPPTPVYSAQRTSGDPGDDDPF